MESDRSFEHRIRVKIGLLFLIIILYVAGIFIYSYNLKKYVDTQKEEISGSYEVLSLSNQLILSVQEAQEALNAYLVNPQKKIQLRYDSLTANISGQITGIRQLASQRDQDVYLESIDSLLHEKNEIVNQLIILFRSQSPLDELDKKIETYNEFVQDSVQVTTNKDTTTVVKDKKGFWDRFRNLFNPRRAPDTIISVSRVEQETRLTSRIDTGVYADLKNTTQAASKTYSIQLSGIEKQVQEFIFAEQNISLQISHLLTKFYNETTRITRQGIQSSELLTSRIFMFAVVVGTLSLVLILIIIFLIIDDLKKGQKARLDLAKEKQLTESLMESRHKLLLSVSHDIKTPLSSMMGYMEMWQGEKMSESKKRQLQSAQNSGKHILSMLVNLLEFSRLERNLGELHNSRFNLIELMDEIIRMFKPLTEGEKPDIEFENLVGDPFYVETDYTVLKQILINVISNAVKYTIKGRIDVGLSYEKGLVFIISDTGIGMHESEIQEIFKPFSRIKNPLKAEGSGFGMYVTQGLVHSLKGEIKIQSKKDEGTRVTIELPLHPVEKAPDGSKDNIRGNNDKPYTKILIFEDDMALGNLIKEFLLQNGLKVKICNNVRDVKGFINHVSLFDIVFTDMQMLNITGNDILHEIRKINSNIPVWLMTAYDDYNTERAVSEGFSGFITKPIQMSRLIDILSLKKPSSLDEKFPQLVSLFGDDTETIKKILSTFVTTVYKDTESLTELINLSDFRGAQQLCHKIHPFINQIGAQYLCDVLIKMDSLRGEDETAYPAWKEDLLSSIRQIREFADTVFANFVV
ncbi:MAG TPA: response regulator [Petrimonas sp.]|uniref:hybrid sensor histidine kinase/response regulator n=1 Tax=Petrimonas sp. TaxID=2023866 RepID=UPI00175457F9|nr:response regulator [Petrimonas sp.]